MSTATVSTAKSTGGSTTKGLSGLVTPYNTSEFQKMVELARAHHHAMHDQKVIISAELYQGLRHVQGNPALFGLDVRMAAKRVTRHWIHAAAYDLLSAQAMIRSFQVYNELFLHRPSKTSKGFDITK